MSKFKVGDIIRKTDTELLEVAFEVLDTEEVAFEVPDSEEVGYQLAPVDAQGVRLQAEEPWWPAWFAEHAPRVQRCVMLITTKRTLGYRICDTTPTWLI